MTVARGLLRSHRHAPCHRLPSPIYFKPGSEIVQKIQNPALLVGGPGKFKKIKPVQLVVMRLVTTAAATFCVSKSCVSRGRGQIIKVITLFRS